MIGANERGLRTLYMPIRCVGNAIRVTVRVDGAMYKKSSGVSMPSALI